MLKSVISCWRINRKPKITATRPHRVGLPGGHPSVPELPSPHLELPHRLVEVNAGIPACLRLVSEIDEGEGRIPDVISLENVCRGLRGNGTFA